MSNVNIKIEADITEAEAQLEEIEQKAEFTADKVVDVSRRAIETVRLTAQIMGIAINQGYILLAESVFIYYETYKLIAAAEASTGVGAAKAALTAFVATLLLIQGYQILEQKKEASRDIDAVIALADTWRSV